MAKGNLSVGAIFEDGGLYYEVQSVLPNGDYISKRVEKPTKEVLSADTETSVSRSTRGRKKS